MPDPTYREAPAGDGKLYTCLIPDAGTLAGICGHKVLDEGRMTEHMQQRHAGVMVKTTDVGLDERIGIPAPVLVVPAPSQPSSPRTPESQDRPALVRPPAPTNAPPGPTPLKETTHD